jgi:uncharacterized membrane protein YhaH (DUF805 family)
MDWKQVFLSGKGRLGRADFWTAWLLVTPGIYLLLQLGVVGDLLAVGAACALLAVLAKRLHDFGSSGWLAPWVYGLVAAAAGAYWVSDVVWPAQAPEVSAVRQTIGVVGDLLSIGGAVVGAGAFLWIGLRRGDAAANRYGPPASAVFNLFGAGAGAPVSRAKQPTPEIWRIFVSARGRIGRGDFWTAWLLLFVVSAASKMLGGAGVLVGILASYPQVCLLVKRLHDHGRSGWWTAALIGVFFAAAAASEVSRALDWAAPPSWATEQVQSAAGVMAALISIAGIVFFFRTGLARGGPGPNRYGPPATPVLSRFGPTPLRP